MKFFIPTGNHQTEYDRYQNLMRLAHLQAGRKRAKFIKYKQAVKRCHIQTTENPETRELLSQVKQPILVTWPKNRHSMKYNTSSCIILVSDLLERQLLSLSLPMEMVRSQTPRKVTLYQPESTGRHLARYGETSRWTSGSPTRNRWIRKA